jgi:hypothetical protein
VALRAFFDESDGDVVQFHVRVVAELHELLECLVGVDPLVGHEDALGLAVSPSRHT